MENYATRPVIPLKPLAAWIGGKRMLASQLVRLIDSVPHATYAEAFLGMGGVFLRRSRAPQSEVINDLSGDVATFFRILQRHYVAFLDMLRYQITSRRDFERLVTVAPSTLTDLERAARFLYLQRLSFGGKVAGRTFGVSPGLPGRFDVTKLVPRLEEVHERLSGVVIEGLDYAEFLRRYDRQETLFYLDPPYFGTEGYYGADMFSRAEFERMAEQLATIKGRFILSINDTPEIRSTFAQFDIEAVDVTWSVSQSSPVQTTELIITSPGLRASVAQDLFSHSSRI
ncbi:DNA methyltransferase [Labrys sp. WJW]|uniref:DNA adenine methylase n=1 Tax=Labrys sp. WJW TaxID=1737983 RepID=UPI000833C387|nr:DNA adenine methylase [Labrys sp. WJW]OCC05288.1 DNA methyltransferase [Labrys sp. WJW]